jgi:GT2 family glycosyltransferase
VTTRPATRDLVSIVIPVRDRREELVDCIESIRRQTHPHEIIVVDDASTDDTVAYITDHYPDVTVLTGEHRAGPSHLRNRGIRAAKGEFVLFLDSDTEMQRPDWLAHVVAIHRAHPDVVLLGGEIRMPAEPDVAFGRKIAFNGVTFAVKAPESDPERLVECDYVATCNCFGRADRMREAGGFDPAYRFGGEDTDFCVRLARRFGRVCVSHATGIWHKRSPRGRHLDETYRYHLTRVRQQLKNAPAGRAAKGIAYDLLRAAGFYVVLLPKLAVKLLRREPLRAENFLGGWMILKACVLNLARLGAISRSRGVDHLAPERMAAFEREIAS